MAAVETACESMPVSRALTLADELVTLVEFAVVAVVVDNDVVTAGAAHATIVARRLERDVTLA